MGGKKTPRKKGSGIAVIAVRENHNQRGAILKSWGLRRVNISLRVCCATAKSAKNKRAAKRKRLTANNLVNSGDIIL